MPRSSKNTETKTSSTGVEIVQTAPVPEAQPVPEVQPVPAPTRKSRKAPVVSVSEAEPVVSTSPQVEVAPAAVAEEPAPQLADTSRTVHTRESVMADFSELTSLVEAEIERLRESSDKSTMTKFLRTVVLRRLKSLQSATARVLKHKAPSARRNNNSGFLKPVNISPEIAKFTGLDPKSQHSRVDVTKFLCKYIADKNLQNPADKRQINADPALTKLLNYDSKGEKPLTYYHMQSLLKNHFNRA